MVTLHKIYTMVTLDQKPGSKTRASFKVLPNRQFH